MINLLITGPTGMIGGSILDMALEHQDIGKVTLLTRRELPISQAKLNQIVHQDFLDYSAIQDQLTGHDACAFCLGVYSGAVPKDVFRTITVDYTERFADAFLAANPDGRFCLLSGQGADRSEKSRMMFARDKGAAENYLFNLGFKEMYTFRPGYIYPVAPRDEPNLSYRVLRSLYPTLSRLYADVGVDSNQLAATMLDVCIKGAPLDTWENKNIRLHKLS